MIEGQELLTTILEPMAAQLDAAMDAVMVEDRDKKKIEQHDNNWASQANHRKCKKQLVYYRTRFLEAKPPDVNSLYRFKEGKDQEGIVEAAVRLAGFTLERQQTRFEWPKYKLSGRTDGDLCRGPHSIKTEIKSISPHYWNQTRTVEDIKSHSRFWIAGIPSQLNYYLLMSGEPGGFLILKTFGKKPRILPMLIDYDLGELDIKTLEAVNAHVGAGTVPDRIPYDSDLCGLCDFAHICKPIKPVMLIDIDEADYLDLREICLLVESKAAHDKLKKQLIGTNAEPGKYFGADAIFKDIEISSTFKKKKKGGELVDDIRTKVEIF